VTNTEFYGTPDADALHAELDSWTPATHLGTDRVCRLQSDGVIAGGVPVGSMGFTLAALTTKLVSSRD
jgi:hypothetical protein